VHRRNVYDRKHFSYKLLHQLKQCARLRFTIKCVSVKWVNGKEPITYINVVKKRHLFPLQHVEEKINSSLFCTLWLGCWFLLRFIHATLFYQPWVQASAAMLMKSVVFWVITRRRVVIIYHTTLCNYPEDQRFHCFIKAITDPEIRKLYHFIFCFKILHLFNIKWTTLKFTADIKSSD
jgi:hypothetical protein